MVYTTGSPTPPRPLLARGLPYILMLLIGYMVAIWYGHWKSNRLHDPNATARPITPRGDLAQDEQSTIELFRSNSPSVVFITTITREYSVFSFNETELSRGTGSGFLWDDQGHVVTNDHVIASTDQAQVTLADQSVWDAKRVGSAPSKDLAVLKINAPREQLEPILIGQSSDLQVGQKVYAIGNPFGLDHTLTTGVISALDREISTSDRTTSVNARRTIDGVIQTDAAINPGNSGGPLLDSGGRLIGVNTAIYSPSGAYAGVGFAIPVDTVNRIVPQLIRHGRIMRPEIGIVPFRDRQFEIKGVLIREVEGGSPAMEAGLNGTQVVRYGTGFRIQYRFRFGDLIVAANGQTIDDLDDWFSFLEGQKVGEVVTLTVVRGLQTNREQRMKVQVALRAAP